MEKALDIDFLLNYPTVVPFSKNNDAFGGYIFINDVAYRIEIKKAKNYFTLTNPDPKLKPFESSIETERFLHPVLLLRKLILLIKTHPKSPSIPITNSTDFYRRILTEYSEFKNFQINADCSLASDLSHINVSYCDQKKRIHQLKVAIQTGRMFKVEEADLPADNIGEDDSLIALYEKFLGFVDRLQGFFDLMDEIDQACWVLDPENPKRQDVYRRIALNDKMSIVININPTNVNELPTIRFLGPQEQIKSLSGKYQTNFVNWDSTCDVLEEILKLLELDCFPEKPARSNEDFLLVNSGECCICFSSRLEDKLPEIVCPNSCCSQFFHTVCLYQWLSSLNARVFYLEVVGNCPNCEKPINCPIPDKQK